jgi:hypothetical protein
MKTVAVAAAFAASVQAAVLWNGFFNSSFTAATFDKWSWSNQIEPWQWYIHGSAATSQYLGVDASFKNPADTSEVKGLRTTIDGTAFWNGQTMERTEIIPQTKANISTGHLYYHFSLKTSSTNPPNPNYEHQIAFFESHFTELKYGTLSGASGADNTLRWMIGGVTKWSTPLVANTWYNFAYDIDFSGGKVGLYYSTGSAALTQVVAPQSASPSSNSADFHIGVLRLPNGGTSAAAEDFFWSGIYVENTLTTSIAGPNPGQTTSTSTSDSSSSSTSTSTTTTTTTTSSTSTSNGCTVPKWGQCGGANYSGCTTCASGSVCTVGNPYYSQCL